MKKSILLPLIIFSLITAWCQAQQPILWGMTSSGGSVAGGVIFNYNSGTDSETIDHNFGIGTDGSAPISSLIKGPNGLLYGMTPTGGTYYDLGGTIFTYNVLSGKETDLHNFNGSDSDGYDPLGTLLLVGDSLLYGTTTSGGAYNGGIVFSYNINTGKLTDLYNFGFAFDADQPVGTPILVNDSMLYGMTFNGGLYSIGTIFSFNILTNSENVVWSFGNDSDGYRPNGSLLLANNGLLYGMTQGGGGTGDTGIIFSYNIAADTEIVVHNFAGGNNDGSSPMGSLMQASDSLLYGMSENSGFNGGGTLFSYNTSTGKETPVWNFGSSNDGISPQGSLIQASNGLLYGMTGDGLGAAAGGIIFSYNIATGKETVIHDFGSTTGDGILPSGDLLENDVIPVQFNLQCNDRDQHSIYVVDSGGNYYRIDSVDTHPTNPVYLGTDTLGGNGISVNNNLDTASGEMTMYMNNRNTEYYYWDSTYWRDTHHTTGNSDAVNPGGTNQFIFNLDAINGIVTRYDGTGNATQLIAGLKTDGVSDYDVATDVKGNFYLFFCEAKKIICYNPDGIPIDSFKTINQFQFGGGFAIIGSNFYVIEPEVIYEGILNGNTVTFSLIKSFQNTYFVDAASCPNAAQPLAVFKVQDAPHFIIFPNPVSDLAIIKMDNTNVIDITDCMGRRITTINTLGLTQYQLSFAGYTPGVYIVTATSPNGLVMHTSLVVQ